MAGKFLGKFFVMHEPAIEPPKPFEVTIGKIKVVEKVVRIAQVPLAINKVSFDGHPEHLLDFFNRLLAEYPCISEGMDLDANEEFKELLLKSRVAFQNVFGNFYPTEEFRQVSKDVLRTLVQLQHSLEGQIPT